MTIECTGKTGIEIFFSPSKFLRQVRAEISLPQYMV